LSSAYFIFRKKNVIKAGWRAPGMYVDASKKVKETVLYIDEPVLIVISLI